jgi:hypothetical protein
MKRRHNLVFVFAIALMGVCSVLGAMQETGSDEPPHPKPKIHVRPKNQPVETPPAQEQPAPPQQTPPQAPPTEPSQSPPPENTSPEQKPVLQTKPTQPMRELPPKLPASAIPQNAPQQQPQAAHSEGSSDLATQVLIRKFGTERVQQILQSVQSANGEGAPNASPYFDGAHVRIGDGEITPREQTKFFQGRSAPSEPAPAGNFNYKATTVEDSQKIPSQYGSVPGGVVLEGQADIGPLENLTYDSRFNALIVDNRAVYFLKISPRILVELCRALAQKDQIGVSLGAVQISYGALPKKSELSRNLLLTDHFLGSIAFAWNDWTAGYRFASEYQPQQFQGSMHAAVFFRFSNFQFQVEQQEFKVAQESFNDQFIPLSNQVAADGGSLPDEAAISSGNVPREWEMNLRHVAENMSYYRREKLIEQTFAYGATAAFLRGLKVQGVDLAELANAIEAEVGTASDDR